MATQNSIGLLIVVLSWLSLLGLASSALPYHDPHCNGRQAIVHLFEWKWTDIAQECLDYLGPMEFCGVQVSPPNEHAIVTTDAMRPWWERYQPVSYKLTSRSGNEAQFKHMVDTCKSVGVRIYADVVVNHMAGLGRHGPGTAGSQFDSSAFSFPAVPFSKQNFNDRSKCPSSNGGINNYNDPNEVRNCYLSGLTDLDGGQSYVQDKIAAYFNHLIDLGVAGFRVDAAKHMWPGDIKAIQAKTKDLPEGGRPFFIMEVIDRNDGAVKVNEYFDTGYVTEFRYCQKVKEGANDLFKLNQVYDPGWGMAPSDQALVFVDNHDGQRSNQVLTFKQPEAYKRAMAFTLAFNYGFPRVMSSYYYSQYDEGPPHNADYSTKDVTITSSGGCGNGWVCEHRWNPIGRMVKFRNAVAGESVDNGSFRNGVLSFNRGNKGFFAMSTSDFNLQLNTGLPPGEYCDLVSACTRKINVDGTGRADISPANGAEPFVAIITKSGQPVNSFPSGGDVQLPTSTASPVVTPDTGVASSSPWTGQGSSSSSSSSSKPDYRRTVILIERQTSPGQDLFIKGGIDHSHRAGCNTGAIPSPCSIPIRHVNPGSDPHFHKVTAWSQGDDYLDWGGAEPGQGMYKGQVATGTPAYWSTSDPGHPGHNRLNKYGPHYWIVEVDMDCSKTESGYFEFKAVVNGQWEGDIVASPASGSGSSRQCSGDSAGSPPYSTNNHMGRCGYLNVFHYNTPSCTIQEFGPEK